MIIKSDDESYSTKTVYYSTSLSWKQIILIMNTSVSWHSADQFDWFNLQTSHVAENASLSEENNEIVAKV